jgi:hypothetical protein
MNKDSKAFLIIFVMGMLAAIQPLPAQNRNPGDMRSVDSSTGYQRIEEDGDIIETWHFIDGATRSKITDPRDGFSVDTYTPAPGGPTGLVSLGSEDGFEVWLIPNYRVWRRFITLMKLELGYSDSGLFEGNRYYEMRIVHDTQTDEWVFEKENKNIGHIISIVLKKANGYRRSR